MDKRSVWAVIAGVLFIVLVTTIVDVMLHQIHFFPPVDTPMNDTHARAAAAYRLVIGIAGAWLTARLAPNEPMRHALMLGVVGIVLGMLGVILTWNLALGPRWYALSLVVMAVPQSWLGGKLFEMRARGPSVPRQPGG